MPIHEKMFILWEELGGFATRTLKSLSDVKTILEIAIDMGLKVLLKSKYPLKAFPRFSNRFFVT